jgi:mRNA interferase HicA
MRNSSVVLTRMNSRQFQKWLAARGCTFEPGKGGHQKVFRDGRRSVLPMHSGEMKKGTMEAIKKQLGIKE